MTKQQENETRSRAKAILEAKIDQAEDRRDSRRAQELRDALLTLMETGDEQTTELRRSDADSRVAIVGKPVDDIVSGEDETGPEVVGKPEDASHPDEPRLEKTEGSQASEAGRELTEEEVKLIASTFSKGS
jgi:hypothetical protein